MRGVLNALAIELIAATNDHGIAARTRDDILRRDPLAYPLTKRATWPADEWSGQ